MGGSFHYAYPAAGITRSRHQTAHLSNHDPEETTGPPNLIHHRMMLSTDCIMSLAVVIALELAAKACCVTISLVNS